jgi:hypothetical protein
VKGRILTTAFWGVQALALVVLAQFVYCLWLSRPQHRPLAEGIPYSPRQMQAMQDNPVNRLMGELRRRQEERLKPPGKEKFRPNRRWKS